MSGRPDENGAPPSRSDRDRRSSRSRSRDRDDRRSRRRSSRSRSRSRSRDSRSRSRERRRRSKKKSGWDQAPEPAAPGMMPGMMPGMGGFPSLQDPAGSMPPHSHAMQQPPQQPVVSGAIHPSRMPQLGNLPGAIPASSGAAMPYNPMQQMQQMQMQQPNLAMLPPHLAALMNPSVLGGSIGGLPIGGPSLGVGGGGAANTANLPGTRQARRLYVGGLPIPISEPELKQFFDAAMKQAFPDLPPGDSVVSIYLNLEKKFGFVEMRTPEEATTGMSLDGIVMRGMTLRIKRPSDYNPQIHGVAPSASRVVPPPHTQGYGGGASSQAFTGQISSQVPDGPNKIFAGGIPYSLGENEVKELLGSFGQLRAFHLVKERESNTSKGYCFFEYVDPNVTDTAVMGLNNLKIGDKTLTVRRAQPKVDAGQATPLSGGMGGMMGGMMGGFGALGDMGANLTPAQIGALAALRAQGGNIPGLGAAPGAGVYGAPAVQSKPATRVLVLLQMVVADILRDDEEYREILEDIESECRRYGEVRCVLIPRPSADGAHVPGMGKVFVEFGAVEHAVKARAEVEGRQFDGRTVAADYMDEGKWARRELD